MTLDQLIAQVHAAHARRDAARRILADAQDLAKTCDEEAAVAESAAYVTFETALRPGIAG